MRFFRGVWIFDIEAIIIRNNYTYGHLPRLFILLAFLPPFFKAVKLTFLYWLCFTICFDNFRKSVLPVPNLFGRLAFFKEKKIGGNAGIWLKYRIRQAHDCVQITVFQEMLANTLFYAVSGQ